MLAVGGVRARAGGRKDILSVSNVVPFRAGGASDLKPRNAVKSERLKLDDIGPEDRPLGDILAYWRSLRVDGKIPPPRRSLDILRLKPVMGWAHIVDCTAESATEFFFRLYGSRVSIFGAKDFSKLRLGEIPCPIYADSVIRDYSAVKLSGCASIHKMKTRLEWHTVSYTRLVLPLADDQRRVSQLLVAVNPRPLPELGELPW